ncbi:thioredoxin domain-containing protein [Enterobacteriaceae endosymbiont of Donacia marginata]|uniref:DsbA family protein n=1 Tax=Enterobacteriaceae endosymbiont of Donacia marginata TaxID=2675779 RepID=UPI001449E0D0|nr:DsbA family protein [Enterobacteriaceae endosymbiont of Donacia marginata]QJC38291.1 thioredoxin domain-containing protein [Enterobacteriaceae endosymbiont of Donacia marginata]
MINIKKYVLFFSMFFLLLITSSNCIASEKSSKISFYDVLTKEEQKLFIKEFGNKPVIVEFFSFLCPHCYELHKGTNQKILKNKRLKNVKIVKIHYNQVGQEDGLSTVLGYTWVVAKILNVEDKVIGPIFDGIHKNASIRDYKSIKKIFIKNTGMKGNMFDAAWNSNIAKILFEKQYDLVQKFGINVVPDIYINNKFIINLSELYSSDNYNFYQNYINLIKKLLKK